MKTFVQLKFHCANDDIMEPCKAVNEIKVELTDAEIMALIANDSVLSA